MNKIVIAVIALLFASPALAGGGSDIRSKSTSSSVAQSQSISNSSTNIKNRAQAPGIAAGGGDCTTYFGISGPGAGLVFGGMGKTCRDRMDIELANQLWNRAAARTVACNLRPALRRLCR